LGGRGRDNAVQGYPEQKQEALPKKQTKSKRMGEGHGSRGGVLAYGTQDPEFVPSTATNKKLHLKNDIVDAGLERILSLVPRE
jgi:hypothetical protein